MVTHAITQYEVEKVKIMEGVGNESVVRRRMGFAFEPGIPVYWFGGDPFRTRFFDACSMRFPAGERFFIQCVRDYAGQVRDPGLTKMVSDFIFQEGQHTIEHGVFNERLKAQGMPVETVDRRGKNALDFFRRILPKKVTLALTTAGEHMTATTAHGMLENGRKIFADADERVVALFAWHGAEEIEHKAVAFRVYKEAAQGGYLLRASTMFYITFQFFMHTFMVMHQMFRADGIPLRKELGLWAKGFRWLFGRDGLYRPMWRHYIAYYRPSFDPWQDGGLDEYTRWRSTYEATGDALAALRATLWPEMANKPMTAAAVS